MPSACLQKSSAKCRQDETFGGKSLDNSRKGAPKSFPFFNFNGFRVILQCNFTAKYFGVMPARGWEFWTERRRSASKGHNIQQAMHGHLAKELLSLSQRATRGHQASCEKELGPRSCRDPTDRNSALSTRQGIVCLPIPSLQEREIRLAEPQGKLGIPAKRDHKDTIQEMQV
ncbi:hypothetical protein CIHG_00031 [Coccidioides immitis H538.4]|uniref:Uncharacterized protein n=2 Tax=Coccidioides immitis TaxID=5501 RepID=A0A0J8RAP9_COCIT|nr:hypothetical protein CIRG_06854 [Coccidioides immitis RMSCC 2394]KMU82245.1 hypothetical protein CIHG_00031 [Coccidioides immitis H538.4]